jgi:signal peptidase II
VSAVTSGFGRALRWPLAIAAAIVVVDQLTKHWALNGLDPSDTCGDESSCIHVLGPLRLHLAFNRGMAFSQGDGIGPLIPILAITVVAVLLITVSRSTSRWFIVGVGLIIGGSVGNVIDRLFRDEGWLRGAVVDFIDLQWWPVFNVADVGIVVGAAMLLVSTLRSS